jgi:hypothetical protein
MEDTDMVIRIKLGSMQEAADFKVCKPNDLGIVWLKGKKASAAVNPWNGRTRLEQKRKPDEQLVLTSEELAMLRW